MSLEMQLLFKHPPPSLKLLIILHKNIYNITEMSPLIRSLSSFTELSSLWFLRLLPALLLGPDDSLHFKLIDLASVKPHPNLPLLL